MKTSKRIYDNAVIHLDGTIEGLSKKIRSRCGVNVNLCLHCQCCASGCPFTEAMDLLPNRVLRMVQLGLEDKALQCSTIWACVGCNTCSIQCPMAIDIPAVMDTLRQMALEEGPTIAEPDVLAFHREVLRSVEKYGRTHKLEIMLRFKLATHNYFSDLQTGLRMLAKRKLDLGPSKVSNMAEVEGIFNAARKQ
jgi:heterodisulfide reductase subunit C